MSSLSVLRKPQCHVFVFEFSYIGLKWFGLTGLFLSSGTKEVYSKVMDGAFFLQELPGALVIYLTDHLVSFMILGSILK